MRDQFLIDFCESEQNYTEVVNYLAKHHPACINDKEADDNYKQHFAINLVNDVIHRMIFNELNYYAFIPDMLVCVRLDEKTVLLAVTPR